MYRKKHLDVRNYEERLLDECTFQPKINGPSPFISERTLRKYEEKLRKPPPPPPGSSSASPIRKSPKIKKIGNDAVTPLGGMYTKANGLIRGPPQIVGIPMFYFDPFNPPNFQDGTYGAPTKTMTVEEEEKEEPEPVKVKVEVTELKPPPLPPYLSSSGKPSDVGAAKKLVITKGPKKEVKEELTGWQAVLAEMEAKKNKNLKKTAAPETKPAETPKPLSSGKKKGKDFKDVMDELNYKLAVLRGDIVEEKDDGDASTPNNNNSIPPFTPPPTPFPTDPESKSENQSPLPTKKSKPDLAAMLAKVKKGNNSSSPATLAATEEKSSEPSSKKVAMEDNKSKIAVPKPDNLPFPPPCPMEWPPKPYILPEKKKKPLPEPPKDTSKPPVETLKIENTTVSDPSQKKVKKIIMKQVIIHEPPKQLPEGYYLAATKSGLVPPFEILEVGLTTQASIFELREQFEEEDQIFSDDGDQYYDSFYEEKSPDPYAFRLSYQQREDADLTIANKLSVNDLPVPGSYMSAVKRLQKAAAMREERFRASQELQFRNYSEESAAIGAGSNRNRSQSPVKRPTVPQEFQFPTDFHASRKKRTFRKNPGKSEIDQLPLSDRLEEDVVHQSIHKYGAVDRPTAYWLQSLRSSSNNNPSSSSYPSAPLHGSNIPGLGNAPVILTELPGSNETIDPYQISQEYYRKVIKSPCTSDPKAPRLLSDEIYHRRQQERQMKAEQKDYSQQFQQQLQRSERETLKEKALIAAKKAGAYKPHNRFRSHQKVIAKYNKRPEIGRVDLQEVTQKAFEQYYVSSGVTSHASSDYVTQTAQEYPWERLQEDGYGGGYQNSPAMHSPNPSVVSSSSQVHRSSSKSVSSPSPHGHHNHHYSDFIRYQQALQQQQQQLLAIQRQQRMLQLQKSHSMNLDELLNDYE